MGRPGESEFTDLVCTCGAPLAIAVVDGQWILTGKGHVEDPRACVLYGSLEEVMQAFIDDPASFHCDLSVCGDF